MNTQNPTDESQNYPTSRRDARMQRRRARREALGGSRSGWAMLAGLALILVGGAYLLQEMGFFTIPFKNWGALFILIPAFGALFRAWRVYQEAGRATASVWGSLLVGVLLICVTGLILFNLNLTILGPALVVLVGVGILIIAFLPK